MNLAVEIPAATAPVQRPAAKTSAGDAGQWQRASARAMHTASVQTDAPQDDASKPAQPASAAKSANPPPDGDSRTRKDKASAKKTEADRRRDPHHQTAASTSAALAVPILPPVGVAASQTAQVQDSAVPSSGVQHVTSPAAEPRNGAQRATPSAKSSHAIADADAGRAQASLIAADAQASSADPAPVSASAPQPADPKDARANPVHPDAKPLANAARVEAGGNLAGRTAAHVDSLANIVTTGAAADSGASVRAGKDIDAQHSAAADPQAPNSIAAGARTGDGRTQKTTADLVASLSGAASYHVGAAGVALAAPAANSSAPVVSHAQSQGATGNNQNALQQLGAQVHDLYQGGGGQTTVQLSPPSLGNVQIHVQMQPNHSVVVSFTASQPQAAQLIQAGIPLLTQALQQSHIQLAQAQVTLANTSAGAGTAFGQQNSAAFQQQAGDGNRNWHSGSLANQGREAGGEPVTTSVQGVIAYA